ncbi:BTAD domain-containing putative transcriptional regulator [Kitasatospora sp. NPDC057223]|uniref:AfsR/SARP family transcriptional regulator n=1 Tax=Kitasatospora sp. NPDC057223 TaxID=3346055 RepID=UPI003635B58F
MRVWARGAEVVLGPPKQRAVLGLLASRVNQVVGVEQIVDAVWGSAVPQTAVNGVHTYVAGLRRVLEPERGPRESGGVLVSAGGGYALCLDTAAVDAELFADSHARARRLLGAGEAEEAIRGYENALALWHGEAYANVPGPFAELERTRLHEVRLTAVEEWAEAVLAASRHSEAVTVLSGLVAKEPLRERLRWLLMLALYRCGRRAQALGTYRETRRLLQDELGIEPGGELRRLHQQILAGHTDLDLRAAATAPTVLRTAPPAPAPAPKPAQLPPGARGFTGRTEESARLRNFVGCGVARPEMHATVAVVEGAPGIGKSALALQLAHQLSESYPDGQLFVDLCGSDPGREPLGAHEALAMLLRSLGIEERLLPADLPGRTALYRSLLHGKRVLIVLDDALHADQVRPLLPRGPACVLVTSRRRQYGLAARDGAYRIELAPLATEDAVDLMACLVGEERLAGQREVGARLAGLCGNLPLALRIAAAGLAASPRLTLAELADYHCAEHGTLDRLTVEDDVTASLRTAFAASVRSLPPDAARMFRLLGHCEEELISAPLAARYAGTGEADAARQLAALADNHLLEEVGRGLYRFHNLIGVYAAECARDGQAGDRATVLARLLRGPRAGGPLDAEPPHVCGTGGAALHLLARVPEGGRS